LRCFHCNEPIPAGVDLALDVRGERRPMCCPGCLAVAELIETQGLDRFYDFRSTPSIKPNAPAGRHALFEVCDRPEVAQRLTRAAGAEARELRCHVEGINCAACAWLIDRGLRGLEGVEEVSVNPLTGDTTVRFDARKLAPSALLEQIARFGFSPRPALAGAADEARAEAARGELKRLAVAGLGFAQVMTLSAALYLGAFKAMQASFETFFVLASLLVATPVVLYSGAPIFRSAWLALSQRRLGMDVPVALAIVLALGASLVNAYRGSGHVYFDSATMFVFFLTLGRFFESRARQRAGNLFSALGELTPLAAKRKRGDGVESVGTIELMPGDHVVVAPGEAVPADGELVSAHATLDESLLSGESHGRARARGDAVLGGSLNLGHTPIEVIVRHVGADSYIERVGGMLHKAMADRPRFLGLADRWARGFIAVILLLTAAVGGAWLVIAPARAFETVLAMLVVTCPCALSLAAPTAFAVALGALARRDLLLHSARALERLDDVTLWAFDKTGTLTEGKIGVTRIEICSGEGMRNDKRLPSADAGAERIARIAAALEAGLEHPIARALQRPDAPQATDVELVPGYGVSGCVDGRRYHIGSARFVGHAPRTEDAGHSIYVADEHALLARIELEDSLRPSARAALEALAQTGARLMLISGDTTEVVTDTARRLGVTSAFANCDPAGKLALLEQEQTSGAVVAAVGDGINDAPLLARADVSIAMVAGSELARASADIVFTGGDLRVLARLPGWARATRRIVRQNLAWAAVYNLAAVPLAAAGVLTPWMAALGMSLSSLVVVSNALRLGPRLTGRRAALASAAAVAVPLTEQEAR
jgi:P-type Cu2+ transporter